MATKKKAPRKKVTPKKKATRKKKAPAKTAAITLRRKRLSQLNDHPLNDKIRSHPEPGSEEWNALKESLNEKFFDPLVWNVQNGYLVSGHLRKKMLLEDGYVLVDVSVIDVDDDTHVALMLAANQQRGANLYRGIGEVLAGLTKAGANVALTTYTTTELKTLMRGVPAGIAGTQLPPPAVTGEDDRASRFLLVYETEAEKRFWMDKLGIDGTKVIYTVAEMQEEE